MIPADAPAPLGGIPRGSPELGTLTGGSPKGAQVNSQGREPLVAHAPGVLSPNGAAVVGHRPAAPLGLGAVTSGRFPGLTPLAINLRPVGANSSLSPGWGSVTSKPTYTASRPCQFPSALNFFQGKVQELQRSRVLGGGCSRRPHRRNPFHHQYFRIKRN